MDGSSEDVSEFLLRIKELGDKRVKEDEERTRKLEEEILQGRKERQARRAERARSISPTKDSPSPSTTSASLPTDHKSISQHPPQILNPLSDKAELESLSSKVYCEEPHNSNTIAASSSASANEQLGSPTIPQSARERAEASRDEAVSNQDLSTLADVADMTEQGDDMMPLEENTTPSRSHISQNLSSKDPAWFRQTADRERGSLALRKNAENTMPEASSTEGGFKLPGLSRDSTSETEKFRDWMTDERSRSPSRASSTFAASSSIGNRYSSMSSISTSGLGSPIPLSAPRLDAPKVESQPAADDRAPLSPGRASPERSVSPTKGLGGFVQSAMLKRSDSISKRWSVQSPGKLSRSNSIVSNRSGVGRSAIGGDILSTPTEGGPLRENSPFSLSRPGSSHSEATVVHHFTKSGDEKSSGQEKTQLDAGFVRPSLPIHTRSSGPVMTGVDEVKTGDEPKTPRSPSKSFDQKRWSPTKASWLESALNRPESPRAKTTPVVQQPAWLRDLSKARQTRASVDLGNPAAAQEAGSGPIDLLRSPPIGGHFKSPSVSMINTPPTIKDTAKSTVEKTEPPTNDKNGQPSLSDAPEIIETTQKDTIAPGTPDVDDNKSPASKASPPVPPNKPRTVSAVESGPAKSTSQPAVTDFRSSLRRRETNNDNTSKEEPEFKNVFGKLRKTERSNYKAPDVLKDNITKGKASLNMTGGPKKSERKDEFRESILKTKDAMKASGGSIRRTGDDSRNISKPPAPLPEALSKRNNLSRTDSTRSNLSVLSSASPTKSTGLESPQSLLSDSNGIPDKISSAEPPPQLNMATSTTSPGELSTKKAMSDVKKKEHVPEANPLPAKSISVGKSNETDSSVRSLPSKVSVAAPKQMIAEPKGLATKGTIAGRVNPALAGILARGPPRAGGEPEKTSTTISIPSPEQVSQPNSTAPLNHMTKARARGPKRRLPASDKAEPRQVIKEESRPKIERSRSSEIGTSVTESVERMSPSKNVRSPPVPIQKIESRSVLPSALDEPVVERPKPLIPSKSPDIPRSSLISPPPKPSTALEEQGINKAKPRVVSSNSKSAALPEVPPKLGSSREVISTPNDRKRSSTQRPTPPPKLATLPLTPSPGNSSPAPSLTSRLRDTIVNSANVSPLQARFGLGLGGSFFQSRPESPLDNKKSPQFDRSSATPPVPPKKDLRISPHVARAAKRSSLTSPVPRTSESVGVISDFFDTLPSSSDRVNIDPQWILTAETDEPTTRTIQKQIWEITGDGKKQDLPKHQDYILFEGSMYVCVHNFECETGNRTESYLWLGDEVSEAAMEDAQLFARRVARENGSRLELVRQGKEPARFVEALGGIIITRRGSSSRSSSSALYMLCGRRHLGQIAFDEVDFSRRNLCSGFVFVISARFGKLYLWKGKGSGADELGSARLIGMNIGLTGEIEEISEGEEPEGFFDVFPNLAKNDLPVISDHWHLKPKHEKYRCRLLRIDHVLGQKGGFWNRRGSSSPITRPNDTVQEIEPFAQKDMRTRDIYILDAFFEIYVIVGSDAKSRAAEFASALVFAHEYGILAASLQDRPFIPQGYVAIGGVPESCTVAFRKWDSKIWPTTSYVLPLNAAIEAIRS